MQTPGARCPRRTRKNSPPDKHSQRTSFPQLPSINIATSTSPRQGNNGPRIADMTVRRSRTHASDLEGILVPTSVIGLMTDRNCGRGTTDPSSDHRRRPRPCPGRRPAPGILDTGRGRLRQCHRGVVTPGFRVHAELVNMDEAPTRSRAAISRREKNHQEGGPP